VTVSPPYSGLIIDWGGVLTTDINSSVRRWADRYAVDLSTYIDIMRTWLGPEGELEAMLNPIHALERGEIEVPHFEEVLAGELSRRTGTPVVAEGLLARMFDEFEHAHDMNALVRRARESGIRTALLSNSWGDFYPRDLWDGMFDVVVISGEVGMRKPDPEIFHFTLERMQMQAAECVFVDDLPHNIIAAADLGIVGVRHVTYEETLTELEALFGINLA
jgi:epoxide hydrolase-like predicted phosphatase